MRLIDADKVNGSFVKNENYRGSEVMALLSQQPVVYDVDKVVGQLREKIDYAAEKAAEYDEAGKADLMEIYDTEATAYRNAERIVKAGGVNGQ